MRSYGKDIHWLMIAGEVKTERVLPGKGKAVSEKRTVIAVGESWPGSFWSGWGAHQRNVLQANLCQWGSVMVQYPVSWR